VQHARPSASADGNRVLDGRRVGVVPAAGARRAAPGGAQRTVAEQRAEQRGVPRVVDLAGEMLQEAVELVEIAVGDGQECGRIGGRRLVPRDRPQLDLELVAEAFDAARAAHQIPAVKAPGERVSVGARWTLPVRSRKRRRVRRAGAVERSLRVQANVPTSSWPGRRVASVGGSAVAAVVCIDLRRSAGRGRAGNGRDAVALRRFRGSSDSGVGLYRAGVALASRRRSPSCERHHAELKPEQITAGPDRNLVHRDQPRKIGRSSAAVASSAA
jgi:hypothetical protein